MTDETNNQPATSKSPSHVAYYTRGAEGQNGFFTRIGAAWLTKKGNGFNIQLDVIPLNGRFTLSVPSEKAE